MKVTGDGTYGSGDYTPSEPGTYRWVASYTGDSNNEAKAGTCGESGETSTVTKASPSISTAASAGVVVGGKVSDQATLSGGASPSGSITFRLYGPSDSTCSASALYTSAAVKVTGDGTYGSGDYTPSEPGTYRWVASYSGDANNEAAAGSCGQAGEMVSVSKDAQSIDFPTLGAHVLGEADFAVSASASSGLPVAFASLTSGVCTVAGADVHLVAVGTCTISASQPGSADYQPALEVQRSFTISAPAKPPAVVVAKPAPPSCPSVRVRSSNYRPRPPKTLEGDVRLPGLRARLSVAHAVRITLAFTLVYRYHGRTHRLALGRRTLSDRNTANLRVVLPVRLRKILPAASHVTLQMQVHAVTKGVSGCRNAYDESLTLHTHIVTLYRPRH
ncbi:MAG: hypothetical protein ACYCYN_04730 [Solirubrobacteraceae bacterium]